VVCPLEDQRRWHERIDGIAVYRFPRFPAGISTGGYFLEYIYAILAIAVLSLVVLLREGFDVIHVANPPDALVLITVPYKLLGKRIIYDQHDLCPELYTAKFPNFSQGLLRFLLWLERRSYALAHHVITPNDSYRQIAIRRGHIAESKITVVRNGPDLANLSVHDVDIELRQRSRNIILYSGTIGVQDGLDCLCRILSRLRYDLGRRDFCCVVMGDGDALPGVKALAQQLHLDGNMWFTGWIADSEMYLRYLNTADICVSPEISNDYNDRSTFVKIMEYMTAGKPIVCFDLKETRFSAQNSALYIGANDERDFAVQVARLMDDPVLRSELGQRGQNRIRKELAWQYSVPGLLSAYDKCLWSRKGYSQAAEYTRREKDKVNNKTAAGSELIDLQ
jgi:glycosyltransferase involved in cell wall biosynthesis